MAGWKEFAHEIRKRDTHYSGATGQHVAVYALDNNRVYIIDETGGLADFQIKDGYFNNVQISGNCRIVGQQIVTDTVIDGYDLIFNLDADEVDGNMASAGASAADWRMDVYSISGVANGFNQLRVFDNNDGKTYISVRKDGAVIIGDYAETMDDDGIHTIQLSGSMVIHGNLDIDGDQWIDGNLYVTGNVDISGSTIHRGGISSIRGSGAYNEAFGSNALQSNTTGYNNTAVGEQALYSNTVGDGNVAIGRQALQANVDGVLNTSIGTFTLNVNVDGERNSAFGAYSLSSNISGSENLAIGSDSLWKNSSGNRNTAIGNRSLHLNETGDGNVGIGYEAGYNEIGSNKLYIANTQGTSADALIYGEFDNQYLQVNGNINITGNISNSSIQSLSFSNTGSTSATKRHLFNKNTSGISSYTINFPPSPSNGQLFTFASRGGITTLTWGGGTANTTPSSVSANDRFTWIYNADDSIWMRIV